MDDIYDPKFVKGVFDRYLFHLKVILSLVERTLLRGAQDFRYTKYFFGCATGVAGRRPA